MISIIIPTLNEESVIGETLKRLKVGLGKTEFEIIVSDGGSSDKTVAIAKKYADRIVKEKNKTIAAGRNLGAKSARGEYLVFFDADTTIPAADKFFSKTLGVFKERPKLVALTVSVRVLPEKETLADKIIFGILNFSIRVLNNVFGLGRSVGEFQMIRASAFRKLNGYNENLVAGEDHEMFYRLSRIGQIRSENSLVMFHSGRRAHILGWPKLLWRWFRDTISVILVKKAVSKEWEVIR